MLGFAPRGGGGAFRSVYVSPAFGDDGNAGFTPLAPVASLPAALTKATRPSDSVLFEAPEGYYNLVPLSVPDLVGWWDLDLSPKTFNAGKVGALGDISRLAPDLEALQATASLQPPVSAAGLNGRAALDTAAGDEYLEIQNAGDLARSAAGATVFYVAKPATRHLGVVLRLGTPSTASARLQLQLESSGAITVAGRRLDADSNQPRSTEAGAYDAGEAFVFEARYDWGGAQVEGRKNGTTVIGPSAFQTPGVTSDTAGIANRIGRGSSATFDGLLGCILYVRRLTTADESQRITRWLGWKYGVSVA